MARLQELKECHQEKDAEERFKQFVDINKESSERKLKTFVLFPKFLIEKNFFLSIAKHQRRFEKGAEQSRTTDF